MVGPKEVAYFVFDIESVADGDLISTVRYPSEDMTAEEAIARYRKELLEERGSDFIPYTFQLPISIAIAKVAANLELLDIVVLDESQSRPHIATELFWRGWEAYGHPTLVTFNGRSFDLPLLELAVFRYGISVPSWFDQTSRAYAQPRNRYNTLSHLDLYETLTNFGASRFNGGLNLAAQLLGKPGKMNVEGCMVQDLYDSGELQQIHNYCRCDVLDTYFVFLRTQVMLGNLKLEKEQQLVQQAKQWLEAQRELNLGFSEYLDRWGEWPNPWREPTASSTEAAADPTATST